ncbi:hypothetical protein D9758_017835 [Tetrapyrgos nigripes]|uniref:Uncharacterized protein n=1 Tax=Tetrapyrgos nigripes TaxID=182062 RepID=A0A8H5B039_9AGAR|nr:hypothetical protein D9758_017835 [Tetrapyrgos nigripes]
MDDAVSPTTNGTKQEAQNNDELLAEIFGGSSAPSDQGAAGQSLFKRSTEIPKHQAAPSASVDPLGGLFSTSSPPPPASNANSVFSLPQSQSPPAPAAPAQPAPSRLTAYHCLRKERCQDNTNASNLRCKTWCSHDPSEIPCSKAAVPKTQQLQMLPMSNPDVNPGVDRNAADEGDCACRKCDTVAVTDIVQSIIVLMEKYTEEYAKHRSVAPFPLSATVATVVVVVQPAAVGGAAPPHPLLYGSSILKQQLRLW